MMNCRFQLAALQINLICNMPSPSDIRHGLEVLPETMKDAYGKIYKRILDQDGSAPRLALGAFRWIKCSYEPLCSKTLLDAITVEVGNAEEFSRKDPITVNGVLKVCQNLLIFDKQLNVFRFAHLSVDEYLETKLHKVDSHGEIAKVCLSLLCTPSSWDTYDKTLRTREGLHGDRHLLLYSAVFWPWHFSSCGDGGGYQILTRLCNALLSETNHQSWLTYHLMNVKTQYTRDQFWRRVRALQEERNDPLFSVCVFGLSQMFATIFDSKPLVEKACLGRLLRLAGRFGDQEIVRLLIDRGADTSFANEDGQTPLHEAAWNGHEAVTRLLMDRGADASVADKYWRTPLHGAAQNRHESVVRLLIDRGADASVADTSGLTPLHVAADGGHEAVVRLLIDRGADASVADKYGWTPLHAAVWHCHESVVLLLDPSSFSCAVSIAAAVVDVGPG